MSTYKRTRPWDDNTKPAPEVKRSTEASSTNVPFIEVDGHRYYSDRFYLNRTVFDDDFLSAAKKKTSGCTCGALEPPPLFDRSKLVASLKLKAAIVATYTVNPQACVQDFPSLFGSQATVPTLVLHGQKGWTPYDKHDDDDEEEEETEPQSEGIFLEHTIDSTSVAGDGDMTLASQEEETREYARQFASPETPPVLSEACSSASKDADTGTSRRQTFQMQLPDHVHWSEITSSWLKPSDRSLNSCIDEDSGCILPRIARRRLPKAGVHHPKFLILLEDSGSIVIVVSTSNLTQPLSTDASWMQRFPAVTVMTETGTGDSNGNGNTTESSSMDGSDFGAVLAHFLQCQTWACQTEQLTPLGFVRRYLGWKTLEEIERRFNYSDAQVHLIATVPGDYPGRQSSLQHQQQGRPSLLIGRQRVAHILSKLSSLNEGSDEPWLPPAILQAKDRLVVQPTSLGAKWNQGNMADVIRSYLNDDDHRSGNRQHTDGALISRLDIIWPTRDFMHNVKQALRGRQSPDSAAAIDFGFAPQPRGMKPAQEVQAEQANGGFIFLSSSSFNEIDLNVLSRLCMYEPSLPEQCCPTRTPHIKTMARLCEGSDYRIRKDYGFAKCQESFSWFLLTSACLSRGAQGEATEGRARTSDTVSYFNFELGVLFCSRLQGRQHSDRLYCWKPAVCSCLRPTEGPALLHLPSPFSFRPARYVKEDDDDEVEVQFCETPYFHEIPPGTCCGNMLITPYGAAQMAKINEE